MAGLKVWRLSKKRYAEAAFTGRGPEIFGGRWNPVGVPVVYSSLSLSLAVLEVFVHMTAEDDPEEYVSVEVDVGINESASERVDVSRLPNDWRQVQHPALQRLGAEWAQSMRSLVLLVPSVVVEGEWNAVINPRHRDAKKMVMQTPRPFRFDERMFKR
jgi:RES domain-containing protein